MRRACVCLFVWAAAALAQPRGQIAGFVQDASGGAIAGASVQLLNLDTGIRRSARTNDQGFYAISSLTPGSYRITVRKSGFQTVARTGVALHALDAARFDFRLEIGSLHEEITVPAETPLLNLSDGAHGMQTSRAPAESLPINGRGIQALIDLAPGVLTTPATLGEAGQFTANGQRPATNYFTVDGVSANNGVSGSGLPGQFSGGSLPAMTAIGSLHNLISLGELDELRVQTSSYSPEYGRLPGAQIAISTRSGSNDFHGELFVAQRHERFAAVDWFANAAGFGRLPQRLTNSGGSLSGPVRRNQTFFLVSSEHIRLRQPAAVRTAVPSQKTRQSAPLHAQTLLNAFPAPNGGELQGGAALHTAWFTTPADVATTSVRLDQALGGAGSLFVRYNRTPSTNRSGYLQGNEARFRSQTVTAGIVSVLAARMTNDARIGASSTRVNSRWLPGAAEVDLRSLLPAPAEAGQKLYGFAVGGIGQILNGDPGASRQGLWNLTDTVAFTNGRHDLRLGVDYQRLAPERDQPIASVVLAFDDLRQLASGAFPGYTFAQSGGGSSLIETLSLFAQDTWHATPRLNITYGLRWEFTPPPSYRVPPQPAPNVSAGPPPAALPPLPASLSATPVWRTRFDQVAPRAGLAYRLNAEGTRVLRAGAGVFYDLGFSSAVDLVNGAPFNRWRSFLGIATTSSETTQYGFDPNLRLPYSVQWNVTVEQSLGGDSALSAGYVASSGRRLLRREAQAPTASILRTVVANNNGESAYHSFQVHYRTRGYRGLQGTASYTWAHAIDNGSWDSATWLLYPGRGSSQDRASANFDVRHSFQAALAYDLRRTRLPWSAGWRLSGTIRARTGFPVDLLTQEPAFGLGFDNEQRPDLVPGVPVWLADAAAPGGRRLNPAAFRQPEAGRQGTLGRNALRGNGLAQIDLALEREFRLGESGRLSLRLEAYNAANSASFGDPVRVMSSPLFGSSVSLTHWMLGYGRPNSGLSPAFQSGGPRVLQGVLTVRF